MRILKTDDKDFRTFRKYVPDKNKDILCPAPNNMEEEAADDPNLRLRRRTTTKLEEVTEPRPRSRPKKKQ